MTHLPAHKHKDEIIQTVLSNRITIVTGETGSGKSTQIPQYILDYHLGKSNGQSHPKIICTQPRRISAISLSQFVAKTRGFSPQAKEVTYQIGGDRANVHPTRTQLIYATTGILKEQILRDLRNETQHTLNYEYIIMDEVHERTVDVDVVLLLMKQVLRKYPHLKLVLMSATINAKHFAQYYEKETDLCYGGIVPIVNIPVRCFEVKEYFLEDILRLLNIPSRVIQIDKPSSDRRVLDIGVKLIQEIDMKESDKKKAILVFLPGLASIVEMTNILDDMGFHVLPAHSTVPTDEQKLIFGPAPEGMRKVVVSTNIAESSITVPDVSVVIDFCLEKQLQLNPITNCQSLNEVFSAKESCEQRKGRAGRTGPGVCYRVLSKKQYEALPDHSSPEIQRTHISRLMLQILRMDVGTPEEILTGCLDPPHESLIASSYSELFTFEAIALNEVNNTVEITKLGLLLSDFPLDVRVGMFLLNCFAMGLEYEGVVVASIISLDMSPIYHNPSDPVGNIRRKFRFMKGTCSDILAAFIAYEEYQRMVHVEYEGAPHYVISRETRNRDINLKKINEITSQVKIIFQRLGYFGIHMPPHEERCRMYEQSDGVHPLVLRLLILVIGASFIDNAFAASLQGGKPKDTRPTLSLRKVKNENIDRLGAYFKKWLGRDVQFTYAKKNVVFDEESLPEKLNSAIEMMQVSPKAMKKIRMPESQRRNDLRFLKIYDDALYCPAHKVKPVFRTKYAMAPVSSSVCNPIISRSNTPSVPIYFVPTQVRGKNDDPKLFASYITRLPEEPGIVDLLMILFSRHIHYVHDEEQLPIYGVTHHSTTHYFKTVFTDELVTLINFVRSHLQTFPQLLMNRQYSREKNLKVVNIFLLLSDLYVKNYEEESEHLANGGAHSDEEMEEFHKRAREIHDVFVQETQFASADGVVRKTCPCRDMIVAFLDDPDERLLSCPPSLSKGDRKVLHVVCDNLGLTHESLGKGNQRYLSIIKPSNFSLANSKMKIKNTFAGSLEEGDARRLRDMHKIESNQSVVHLSSQMKAGISHSFENMNIVDFSAQERNVVAYVQIAEDELDDEPETCTLTNGLAASIWQEYCRLIRVNVATVCCIAIPEPNDTLFCLRSIMTKVYKPHDYYWFKPEHTDVRDSELEALREYYDDDSCFEKWHSAEDVRFVIQDQKDFYSINANTPDHSPLSIVFNGTLAPFIAVATRILKQQADELGNMVCRALLLNPKSKVDFVLREFDHLSHIDSAFSVLEGDSIPLDEDVVQEWDSLQQKFEDQVKQYHFYMEKGSLKDAMNAARKGCYQAGSEMLSLRYDKMMLFHVAWYMCLMTLPFFPSMEANWSINFGKQMMWSSSKKLSWNIFDEAHVKEHCHGRKWNRFYDEFMDRLYVSLDLEI